MLVRAIMVCKGKQMILDRAALNRNWNSTNYSVSLYPSPRNEPFKTVEGELLRALLKLELIDQEKYDKPQLFKFQRAARTDKGVSAMRQIISCNFPENFPDSVEQINANMPEEIRLLGALRTIPSFDSRNFVDFRTYSYTFPTFAIAPPKTHLSTYYRVEQSLIDRCNELLSMYKGTHNFHNFTSGRAPSDNSSMRYILEISCSPPFQYEEMEFAKITVRGQSFMLHQIRKMIGLVFAIMRGYGEQGKIERSFLAEKQDIPIAPSLGLLLERVHYDTYNRKYTGDGIRAPLLWEEHNQEIEDFKRKFIFSNLYEQEKKTFSMINWLDTLQKHSTHMMEQDEKLKELHGDSKDEPTANGQTNGDSESSSNRDDELPSNGDEPNADAGVVEQVDDAQTSKNEAESDRTETESAKNEVESDKTEADSENVDEEKKEITNGISVEDVKLRN